MYIHKKETNRKGTENNITYLILPMKYGAISVKYISYFLKIDMKYKYESAWSQNSYLF
jgi:hypothetical protein